MNKFICDVAEVGMDICYAAHWLLLAGMELSCIFIRKAAMLYRTRTRITILRVTGVGIVRDVVDEKSPGIGK